MNDAYALAASSDSPDSTASVAWALDTSQTPREQTRNSPCR